MIIKQYLSSRFSREGCIPDRIYLQAYNKKAEQCIRELTETNKTAHYHISAEGCVTALTPLSAAANRLGPTGTDPEPESNRIPAARRGILILVETETGMGTEEQKEPLIRLLKGIQKEIFRIYGERFFFCHQALCMDPNLFCKEELLEQANHPLYSAPRFRVQTGSYLHRRDAEEKVEQLMAAGIAAYITEVRDE